MPRSLKYGNDTLDVLNKGCFDRYDQVACGRISTLVLVGAITCCFVLLKIVKYHAYKHSQMHHYLIFYISAIQCVVCATGTIFGNRYPQLDFTTNYLKLLHFVLICHLFWSSAARTRHRDDIVQHVVNPVLGLYTLYLTTVVLMGMVDIGGTWTECLRPYWLMLSGADFIAVQLFASVALYLAHSGARHSTISTLMLPTIYSEARHLWLITIVFEISAVSSVIFDSLMSFVGKEDSGCSGIYNHVQVYYSLLIMIVVILKYYLPTWVLLWIFQPSRVKSRTSDVGLTSNYNMDGTCENQYRRMFFSQSIGLPGSFQYPEIACSSDLPIYGSFGDFSYTDSSSDISPTTARCWSTDEDVYGTTEKNLIGIDQDKDNVDSRNRIDHNRQNYEKSLNWETPNDEDNNLMRESNAPVNGTLTTINEESIHVTDSPHK